MLQLNLDFGIVFEGLMSGELSSEQAAVLFRERKHAVGYYLPDRLGETLRDPRYKDTTDLDCPAGRLLDTYWRVFGPAQSVILFCSYDLPLVDCFLNAKLRDHLDEFTDTDLATFERVAWGKPIHAEVRKARARTLIPIADLLIRNPHDLNQDIVAVKNRVSEYNFPPELNEVLDKVGAGLAAGGDQFDQAGLLKHLRAFFEKLHEHVGQTLRARKSETVDGTNLASFGQAIGYLLRKEVLKEKMHDLGKALYGVLSNEGVHALKAEREYVRLCRNMVVEYAIVLFFELERRLRA